MEEALRTLLANDGRVAARVGGRIDWRLMPQAQAAQDAIVLHRISGGRDNHMQAASGLVSSRVQIDCRGLKYSDAKLTARAVIAAVNGFRGNVSGIGFSGIFIDGERDDDQAVSGDVKTVFITQIDIIIWHSEGA